MIQLNDLHPLSDFQKNAEEHLRRLKETGQPEVLTVNGQAELVVQDAASYRQLLEAVDRAEAVGILRQRLASTAPARPMRDALKDIATRHGVDLE